MDLMLPTSAYVNQSRPANIKKILFDTLEQCEKEKPLIENELPVCCACIFMRNS